MKSLIDYFIPHADEGICMAFSGGVDSSVLLAPAGPQKQPARPNRFWL